jgi:hypothetical protein
MSYQPARRDLDIRRGTTLGPYVFRCLNAVGEPVDLTGWTVEAKAALTPGGAAEFNLTPTVTNAEGGEVTIERTDEQTALFPVGRFGWDLVFTTPGGVRMPPHVSGVCTVTDIFTPRP